MAAALGVLLASRPAPEVRVVERIVEVPVKPVVVAHAPEPPEDARDEEADARMRERIRQYWSLRDRVLKHGVEALPEVEVEPEATADASSFAPAQPVSFPHWMYPTKPRRAVLPRWLTGESS